MSTEDSVPSGRHEARFDIKAHRDAIISFERAGGQVDARLPATLLDLSPGGAKLSVETPVMFQEEISLRIESAALQLNMVVSARVVWLRAVNSHRWTLGCAFSPALPASCIEELFAKGLLERRQAPRVKFLGKATAQWELQPTAMDVQFVDLSAGGVAILAPQPDALGQRLMLSVERPDGTVCRAGARAQWQFHSKEGCLVGCEFTGRDSYQSLRGAVALETAPLTPCTLRPSRWRAWAALAGAGLLATGCWLATH